MTGREILVPQQIVGQDIKLHWTGLYLCSESKIDPLELIDCQGRF